MKEKYKKLEALIVAEGLSREDVIAYLQRKEELSNSEVLKPEKLTMVNPDFPADDIRSRTKLFWYAFEGGKFSPDPKAYPNCQGVVGWINPDPNAPEGNKIYVVLPEQQYLQYSTRYCLTGADDLYDGRANTKKLIEYGKKHNVCFPAAERAFNYCENGVKQGESFLPARDQLSLVARNCVGVRKALKLIGGTFEGWLWSSSEESYHNAWDVLSSNDGVGGYYKYYDHSVSCFLAY